MKKLILLPLLIILCSLLSSASTSIFSDNFDYSDSPLFHGWIAIDPVATIPSVPQNSFGIFTGNSWGQGINASATGTQVLQGNLSVTVDSGVLTFRMNISDQKRPVATDDTYKIYIFNNSNLAVGASAKSNSIEINISHTIGVQIYDWDGADCTLNFSPTLPYVAGLEFEIDLINHVYTLRYNGTTANCEDIFINPPPFAMFRIEQEFSTGNEYIHYLDHFDISTTSLEDLGLYGVGVYCEDDSDCLTGKCEYGACVKKSFKDLCTQNSECISGICENAHCTDAGVAGNIEASLEQQYGDDDASKNFVALFLMVGIMIVIILATKSRMGIIAGIATFYAQGIYWAVRGWLSPFILLGMFLVVLIAFMFIMIIGHKSE